MMNSYKLKIICIYMYILARVQSVGFKHSTAPVLFTLSAILKRQLL